MTSHPSSSVSTTGAQSPRSFTVGEEDTGTSAATWAAWRPAVPALSTEGWRRVVVLAAHPDDEALGIGGLLARLAGAGVEVVPLCATDGEAAYRDSTALAPEVLAPLRRQEHRVSLDALGLGAATRMGIADGRVGEQTDRVADALVGVLREGDVILAPWRLDGHPDHEAIGWAAHAAAQRVGATLVEYPIWMWHWASPDDERLDPTRLRHVALDASERSRKEAAVAAHVSQLRPEQWQHGLEPILPDYVCRRLVTGREIVFVP